MIEHLICSERAELFVFFENCSNKLFRVRMRSDVGQHGSLEEEGLNHILVSFFYESSPSAAFKLTFSCSFKA